MISWRCDAAESPQRRETVPFVVIRRRRVEIKREGVKATGIAKWAIICSFVYLR
jgi:hypothetical protein